MLRGGGLNHEGASLPRLLPAPANSRLAVGRHPKSRFVPCTIDWQYRYILLRDHNKSSKQAKMMPSSGGNNNEMDEAAAGARLQALRVAKSELETSKGPVHYQLSSGAAFFVADNRSTVQERVDGEIRQLVSKLPPSR